MYSLWQNNVQLGRLIDPQAESIDDEEVAGYSGLLLPLADLNALRTVLQTRCSGRAGLAFVHEAEGEREPQVYSDGQRIGCTYPLPAFLKLGPNDPGVPPELVFSIRSDDGTDVPTYTIGIERRDLPDDSDHSSDLREAGLPTDLRFVFLVGFIFDHAYPPRAFMEAYKKLRDDSNRADNS